MHIVKSPNGVRILANALISAGAELDIKLALCDILLALAKIDRIKVAEAVEKSVAKNSGISHDGALLSALAELTLAREPPAQSLVSSSKSGWFS